MKDQESFKPYIPAEKITAEMTATSVIMGIILSVVFGAANAYLGLRVGMTVSASIPAAVISMGVIRVLLKKNSILESNMVQTIGSAGESLAAGAIFTMPALFLWAKEGLCDKPSILEITLIALCGGILGVLFMVPLRNALIVKEHATLLYPEGTACADVLLAGEEGGANASTVFSGMGLAAIFKFIVDGLKMIPADIAVAFSSFKGALGMEVYPALLGVGYIVGPKTASYMFTGSLVGWMVIIPLSRLFGCNMKDGSIGKISENRFARADLEHTLLCVDDDMRMEALRQTNYVKSIVTAQGQMDLERKGKQSYQGWMYARLLAFSNGDLQALYDRSDGFYRRQLILTTKDKPLSRVDDPDIAEKMAAEVEGILLWAFEGLQRLVKNGFQFTESDRAKRNRELVKRDNNVFDFLESEGYIRLKADACTSSKELYEIYKMWCEENSLNAIKARGFSDALIANQRRYNLEHTNNIINSSGRRVRGFVGIEALVQPDLTPQWLAGMTRF